MRLLRTAVICPIVLVAVLVSPVMADEVTYWNALLFRVGLLPPVTNPLTMTRNAAIVHASVFEAINGIERRFMSLRDMPANLQAPAGASRRAAIVQAAYVSLKHLYPGQATLLDAERATSLAAVASGEAAEQSESIARGVEWGEQVAEAIWTARFNDGFNAGGAAYDPGPAPIPNGRWRPTPPAFLPSAGYPQFWHMTPWVMLSSGQFRPVPPPALTSTEYANDFKETHDETIITKGPGGEQHKALSLFWNEGTAGGYWDQIAITFAEQRHLPLSEKARLLAMVNVAMADAAIGCWEAKYTYVYWRPITAITAANDGNATTVQDPGWTTLFATPAHPDYPSGHSCLSGAAAAVLTRVFGDSTPFDVTANVTPNSSRSFLNFSDALREIRDARVFPGIHFRTATEIGTSLGADVANYVMENAFLPLNGRRSGQLR